MSESNLTITVGKTLPWQGVIIHHSETEDGDKSEWEAIRRFHMSYRVDYRPVSKEEFEKLQKEGKGTRFEKPDRDIAYNYGIEKVGNLMTLQMGRPLDMFGAHAGVWYSNKSWGEYNKTHLGLCVLGHFDLYTPDSQHWDFALQIVRVLRDIYKWQGNDFCLGHREIYGRLGVPQFKTCPGKKFDVDLFRSQL